jgi:hypothetical protein
MQCFSRLSELASKVDNIIHLLSRPEPEGRTDSSQNDSTPSGSNETDAERHDHTSWLPNILDGSAVPEMESFADIDFLANMNPVSSPSDEPLEREDGSESNHMSIAGLDLSPCVLEHLLDTFRTMSNQFPFVYLPVGSSALMLAKDRPFLLLGAVASASSSYPHLQKAFSQELKETLTSRVHMAGEVNLDLLQGLLLYLAW